MTGDDFPALLGRLKERSGLSYGVLGKRLHMSASTLHRYVNGDAVPTDYAPVERLARLCRATPEELVELHRQWILADARRGQKSSETAPAAQDAPAEEAPTEADPSEEAPTEEGPGEEAPADVPDVRRVPPEDSRPPARRRRTVVLAGAAVVAAVVAAALVVNLVPDGGKDDRSGKQPVGAAASESATDRPGTTKPTGAKSTSPSPTASRGGGPTASVSASRSGGAVGGGTEDGATAPTVSVNPYKWEDQCSQHYLVDQKADQVPPPPSEPDARGWVKALGGIAAGEQMLALTVQGTGKATVVLEALHVRVVDKSAPLAWNDFAMGDGCGGGVRTTAFGVNLDAGRPALAPRAGQRDFPYKVSESDPEVFYVFADARTYNVSWYLELEWSSGDRNGVVRVDDKGNPFRTSGHVGRPAYIYPLGGSEWIRHPYDPDVPG